MIKPEESPCAFADPAFQGRTALFKLSRSRTPPEQNPLNACYDYQGCFVPIDMENPSDMTNIAIPVRAPIFWGSYGKADYGSAYDK